MCGRFVQALQWISEVQPSFARISNSFAKHVAKHPVPDADLESGLKMARDLINVVLHGSVVEPDDTIHLDQEAATEVPA